MNADDDLTGTSLRDELAPGESRTIQLPLLLTTVDLPPS